MADEHLPARTSGSEVEQRVILGAVPRLLKLGRCVALSAPRAMVRDLTQHEGLHPRLNDCFGWTWDARAIGDAYQRQIADAFKQELEAAAFEVVDDLTPYLVEVIEVKEARCDWYLSSHGCDLPLGHGGDFHVCEPNVETEPEAGWDHDECCFIWRRGDEREFQ